MNRNAVARCFLAAAALLVAFPSMADELPTQRAASPVSGETQWGPFVYERLGATPSLRIGQSAAAPDNAARRAADQRPQAVAVTSSQGTGSAFSGNTVAQRAGGAETASR